MTKITRIKCGDDNSFCVEQDGSAILIDTARTQYLDRISAACQGKNIRLILLTHGHVDHIQNTAALQRELHAPVAMHIADIGLIQNNLDEPMSAHTLIGKLVLKLTGSSFTNRIEPFKPDIFLRNGDRLDTYGVDATVIGLPGHTKGSIGVLLDSGDFFVGDALMNLLFPSKSLLYGGPKEMLLSAAKISEVKPTTIYFGHGRLEPANKTMQRVGRKSLGGVTT